MKIKITELTTERKWRAATGLDKNRFYKLLDSFSPAYLSLNGKTIKSKEEEMQTEFVIRSEEELLLFTLFSLKSGLSYDILGIVSGMDASNAKRHQEMGVIVLKHALGKLDNMPVREFNNSKEFSAFFASIDELIIDATEQAIQRPSDKEVQKESYSGKKNTTH